jgi:hypothetical protein
MKTLLDGDAPGFTRSMIVRTRENPAAPRSTLEYPV